MSAKSVRPKVDKKKKILIAVHQGFSIRYILQTDIFTTLKESGNHIIVLSQDDPEYLKAKFGGSNISFDSIPWSVGRGYFQSSRLLRMLDFVRHYTHSGFVKVSEHHYWIAIKDGKLNTSGFFPFIRHKTLRGIILAARRIKILRSLLQFLQSRYFPSEYYAKLESIAPDIVVTTSLGTFDFDHFVMRACNKINIPVIPIVLSWDNTTCRGYPGAKSDHVIAWTEIMKQELIRHNDVKAENISVCGVAHFDKYFRQYGKFDRAGFMSQLGLDPLKRTVVIATKSPNTYAFNPNLGKILGKAIQDGRLPHDVQVLLRIHPLFYRYREGRFVFKDALDACKQVANDYSAVILNEPTIVSDKLDYDMSDDEMDFVMKLLLCTDVLVNIYSTMNIEGAIFDVPLVNAYFHDDEYLYNPDIDARFNIDIDHDSDHNLRIVNSGGTLVARSSDELVEHVRLYLENPELHSMERKLIVENETGNNHGVAGRKIGERIIELSEALHTKAK